MKYFTSIDLCSGYWKCSIADENIPKTAFLMRYSLYEWVVMPMGLKNAPAMFMKTMNNLFSDMLDSVMAVFLDDVLVHLCTVKEHLTLLNKVLACLYQYKLYCKLRKYSFLHNNTTFLSFDITPESMFINCLKVQSLNKWPVPTTVKYIQLFLGLYWYYKKLIQNYSAIAKPLHKLTHKNKLFSWTD